MKYPSWVQLLWHGAPPRNFHSHTGVFLICCEWHNNGKLVEFRFNGVPKVKP